MRAASRNIAVALYGVWAASASAATLHQVRPSDLTHYSPSDRPASVAPALHGDEVVLISSRRLGSQRDPTRIAEGLHCERLVAARGGPPRWVPMDWRGYLQLAQRPLPTVVFVHGNRVERGEDRNIGMSVYRAIQRRTPAATSFRLLLWSWPAAQIRGPVKDFKLKAARTMSAAWQLAWVVDQMPTSSRTSFVGYSLGARVVSGALHLLGGGQMGGVALPPARQFPRPRMNAALIAAAVNADWLRPNGYHGRGLERIDRLFVVTNRLDPAMRFYRFGPTGRGAQALGYAGPIGLDGRNENTSRVIAIDATSAVGRTHVLGSYLVATPGVDQILRRLVEEPVGASNDGRRALTFAEFQRLADQ